MSIATDETPLLIYLHFSDNSPSEESEIKLSDGKTASVIWKDVLVEGEYPLTPGPTGPIKRKLTVIPEGESSREDNIVAMSDLMDSHEDGAFKYVTIPTSHKDGPLENTGYVPRPKGLRVVEKTVDGAKKKVMQAALGFTEPDVKGKVQRGTIPDCSAGIFFNWLNKHKNKRYRAAMKHVALTPTPFMGNLAPFAPVFAADEEIDADNLTVQHFMFAEGEEDDSNPTTGKTAEVIWIENKSLNGLRRKLEEQLNPKREVSAEDDVPMPVTASYYVEDVSNDNNALATEYSKGRSTRFVIPFSVEDNGDVSVAPATRWMEVKEAMIAASDDFVSSSSARERLQAQLKETYGDDAKLLAADVSFDQRLKIVNGKTGAEYVTSFALLSDDSVFIEPSAQWERVKAPDKQVQPVDTASPNVALSDNQPDTSTPEGRVEAARQRRQRLLSK